VIVNGTRFSIKKINVAFPTSSHASHEKGLSNKTMQTIKLDQSTEQTFSLISLSISLI
jgi:hypothetical protein